MRKILLLLLILIITNSCFAIQTLTKDKNREFLKSLNLKSSQISQIEELDIAYSRKIAKALEESIVFKMSNPHLPSDVKERYCDRLLYNVDNEYEEELKTILTRKQRKKYLKYKSKED